MLGWEFPPHISGGLGTACEGITRGLSHHGVEIVFVVPHLFGDEDASHIALVNSEGQILQGRSASKVSFHSHKGQAPARIYRRAIPSHLRPYLTDETYQEYLRDFKRLFDAHGAQLGESFRRFARQIQYGGDIFAEVERYALTVLESFMYEEFDLVHAHDWMTFRAGVEIAKLRNKPLVTHIHSLESDRSGSNGDGRIEALEQLGVHAARQVVAVSYYTRQQIHERYHVPLEKISVVHNGIYPEKVVSQYRRNKKWKGRLVLFLGRVTYQKGPEYFVEMAAKVAEHVPDSMFVMAGSGDMLQRMVNRVQELGLERHFMFPGFLKGQEVEEMFSLADVYVMPSVSEPFGISALEAMKFETPVVLSRQSGVSEVVSHALKADFWDVDKMADLIINALLYPELREEMVAGARDEVHKLHWNAAALRLMEVYQSVT